MVNYEKIAKNLINENFRSLKNKVFIELQEMDKWSMFAKMINRNRYIIIIDPVKTKGMNKKEIEGVLAHELSHFDRFAKWNYLRIWLDHVLYFFRTYRRWTEKVTDKLAINKGYAKELAAYRGKRLRENPNVFLGYHKGVYMTPEQIKSYAKKVGKW